jgi:hypothetical protein
MTQAADPFHIGIRNVALGSHQSDPSPQRFVESATRL